MALTVELRMAVLKVYKISYKETKEGGVSKDKGGRNSVCPH